MAKETNATGTEIVVETPAPVAPAQSTAIVPTVGSRITANKARRATSVLARVEPQGADIFSANAKAMSEADARLIAGQLLHTLGPVVDREDAPTVLGFSLSDVADALVFSYDSTQKQIVEENLNGNIMAGLFVSEMSTKAAQSRNFQWHRVMRHVLLQVKGVLLPLITQDSPYTPFYGIIDAAEKLHYRAMQQKPAKAITK